MVFEVCTDVSEKVGWFEDSDDWSSLSLHMERDGLKELLSKNKVMMKSSEVMHLARCLGIQEKIFIPIFGGNQRCLI